MATAVEPSSASSTPGKALSLPVASLLGAIYALAALVGAADQAVVIAVPGAKRCTHGPRPE